MASLKRLKKKKRKEKMMQHLDQHPRYELLAIELLKRREYYSHKSKFEAQDCSGPLDKAHAYDKYLRRLCALARVGEHDKIVLEFGGEEEAKQELSDSFSNGLGDGLATVDEDTPLGSDGVNQNGGDGLAAVDEDTPLGSDGVNQNGLGDGLATVDEDTPLGSDGVNQNVENEESADMNEANSEEEEDVGEEQQKDEDTPLDGAKNVETEVTSAEMKDSKEDDGEEQPDTPLDGAKNVENEVTSAEMKESEEDDEEDDEQPKIRKKKRPRFHNRISDSDDEEGSLSDRKLREVYGPEPGTQENESEHEFESDAPAHEDDASLCDTTDEEESVDSPHTSDDEFIDDNSEPSVAGSESSGYQDESEDEVDDDELIFQLAENEALNKAGKAGKSKIKRLAGMPPKSIRQQLDAKVREKILGLRIGMTRVHHMSVPLAKRDGHYKLTSGQRREQMGYPEAIIGLYAYIEQKPNADGKNKSNFLDTPEFHMWVPSEHSAGVMKRKIGPKKDNDGKKACMMGVHNTFDGFYDSLCDKETQAKAKSKPQGSKRHRSVRDPAAPHKKSKIFKACERKVMEQLDKKKKAKKNWDVGSKVADLEEAEK